MKEAVKAWENHGADLQRELDAMKGKSDAPRPSSPNKKRKKVDEDTIPVPRSPKKSKTNVTTPSTVSGGLHLPEDQEFSQAGETGDTLLRSVYHIHAIVRSNLKTESLELAYQLQKASATLPAIVLQQFRDAHATTQDDLKSVLSVASRTVVSILVGFNRLSHIPEGVAVQNRIIYAIVQLFKDFLAGLEQLSKAEACEGQSGKPASSTQKQIDKSKAKIKSKVPTARETSSLSMYTSFLCGVVDSLDSKLDSNKSLFEGISYCVLDRLGNRLFTTVFGHSRGATTEGEILQSRESEDEIEDPGQPPLNEIQLKQVRIEAPYLIHLLNKIMSLAPAYFGSTSNSKAGKTKSSKTASKGVLSIAAKECLQRTLVNGIFGMEGRDEDDPFMDFLSMPSAAEDIPTPKVKEADIQEWFKEEVWRVLGWGILAHEKI